MKQEKLEKLLKNIENNNMKGVIVKSRQEALNYVKNTLPKGSHVARGGSVTLNECGIDDLLKNGDYLYNDKYKKGITNEEVIEINRKDQYADFFLTSANAITEAGVLYNVDGAGNRVSAIAYGPKNVIVVVGVNKIVKYNEDAIDRVKTISAPKNCVRLGIKTLCAKAGKCQSLVSDVPDMTDGCQSLERICCHYLLSSKQRVKDRITIVIVKEKLGY